MGIKVQTLDLILKISSLRKGSIYEVEFGYIGVI